MSDDDETIDIEGGCPDPITPECEALLMDIDEPPSKSVKLLPELDEHPWMLEQGWSMSLDHCTDERSKAAIERMLMEEKQYFGGRVMFLEEEAAAKASTSNSQKTAAKPNVKPVIPERRRWTQVEKSIFYKGYTLHGNKWSRIAKMIRTKTTIQVKNYGHKYLKGLEQGREMEDPEAHSANSIDSTSSDSQPKTSLLKDDSGEIVRIKKVEEEDSDEDLEVDVDSDTEDSSSSEKKVETKVFKVECQSKDSGVSLVEEVEIKSEEIEEPTPEFSVKLEPENETEEEEVELDVKNEVCEDEKHGDTFSVYSELSDDEHENEYGIFNCRGEVVYVPNPTEEKFLSENEISEDEIQFHAEFFDGRKGLKTEYRYSRIRNYIYAEWLKSKPNYLKKTAVRTGLKNCGDVNCIGRIHAYLEQMGYINYGCEQAQYRKPRRGLTMKSKLPTNGRTESNSAPRKEMRQRKRRVKNAQGDWVDEKDLEGTTLDHDKKPENPKPIRKKKVFYDPFMLISCHNFTEETPAPFVVEIERWCLVIMDIHSHMCKTEVIGLLGGMFDNESRQLKILSAEPCSSLSTGMQCEMDPVSETMASENIRNAGFQVVGWYHSHPTFAPNPSIRDLETQENFQTWFAMTGAPFVGAIVNPYNPRQFGSSLESQFTCLTVIKKVNEDGAVTEVPYQFEHTTSNNHWDNENILRVVRDIADKYQEYPNKVDLLHNYRSTANLTCLEKMMYSINKHVPEDLHDIKPAISEIFEEKFSEEPKTEDLVLEDSQFFSLNST